MADCVQKSLQINNEFLVDINEFLPLEIIVRILDNLPGRSVRICKQVCQRWCVAAKVVMSKDARLCPVAELFLLSLPKTIKPSFFHRLKDFFDNSILDIDTIVLFNETTHSDQPDKIFCEKMIQGIGDNEEKCIGTKIVGCTVKYPFGPQTALTLLGKSGPNVQNLPKTSCALLIPRSVSFSIHDFHIPMKKKYEMIKGFCHFLPKLEKDVPLVLVFIHPISMGRLSNFIKAVRKAYSLNTCIVGLYSETCIYNKNIVTNNEIMGLAFAGDFRSLSIVIQHEDFVVDPERAIRTMRERVRSMTDEKEYIKLAFLFASSYFSHKKMLQLLSQIKRTFIDVSIFGAYASSVFGADHSIYPNEAIPGGRDFLQTKSAILCFVLMSKDKQKAPWEFFLP